MEFKSIFTYENNALYRSFICLTEKSVIFGYNIEISIEYALSVQ